MPKSFPLPSQQCEILLSWHPLSEYSFWGRECFQRDG